MAPETSVVGEKIPLRYSEAFSIFVCGVLSSTTNAFLVEWFLYRKSVIFSPFPLSLRPPIEASS